MSQWHQQQQHNRYQQQLPPQPPEFTFDRLVEAWEAVGQRVVQVSLDRNARITSQDCEALQALSMAIQTAMLLRADAKDIAEVSAVAASLVRSP